MNEIKNKPGIKRFLIPANREQPERRALHMRKLYRVVLGALALSALLLSGCAADGAAENSPEPEATVEASADPSAERITFEGRDLEGNAVSSSIFSQSKLTMINVWSTSCGPCLNEMPDLGALAAEYSTEEFQIIGVVGNVLEGTDQELVESLVQQTGANYPHLLLNESLYYAFLTDVRGVPTTFFLDKNGVVLDTVLGAKEKSVWEETINELLAEQ